MSLRLYLYLDLIRLNDYNLKEVFTQYMAKKSTNKKDSYKLNAFVELVKKERPRFLSGVFFVFISFYTLLAQISFFFTGASDQSKILNKSFWELISEKQYISNWTGVAGAYIAERLINQWLGIFSIFISIYILFVGLKLMRLVKFSALYYFFLTAYITLWGSIFCSLTLGKLLPGTHVIWGGAHGQYIESLLETMIGIPGLVLLLTLLLVCFIVIVKRTSMDYIQRMFTRSHTSEEEIKEETIIEEELEEETPKKKSWFANLLKKRDKLFEEENEIQEEEKKDNIFEHEDIVLESIYEDDNQFLTPSKRTSKNSDEFEVVLAEEEDTVANNNHTNQNGHPTSTSGETHTVMVGDQELEEYDPRLDLSHYAFPTNALLKVYDTTGKEVNMEEQNENKNKIISTLLNYGIEITSIKATVGPTITLYEIVPKAGVRISKIRNLEDDIALSLSALGIRIIAPIPGKGTIGIEVPNKNPQIVSMQSVISSKRFQEFKGELPIAIGKTITNETFVFDLAKMPHLLVAGATGQGKSVGLNAIITSLLYKKHPAELKMVLIDPKMVEFSIYSTIEKHYLAKLPDEEKPIITDVTKVTQTLNSLTIEMDQRYELLMNAGVRNIIEYNELFKKRRLSPRNGHKFLPYMVIVIDEFGDLIMTAGKEIEMPIARIAQKARAVGMHLIIATQRPTTNIITGTIKANFPARMAFRVMSQIDSRTILDQSGANQLIGRGDMLFSQGSDLVRIQCAFVDTPEVQEITNYIGEQQGYAHAHDLPEYVPEGGEAIGGVDLNERDALFEEAARLIVVHQSGSTSLIQRKFSIGYNRAGRLMDQLEAAGIVGPTQGSKPREVYIQDEYSLEQIFSSLG